jgi:hypothetical protein
MNAIAVIYVNRHLESLAADAAEHRSIPDQSKRSLRQRLASIAGAVKSTFADPIVASGSVTSAN